MQDELFFYYYAMHCERHLQGWHSRGTRLENVFLKQAKKKKNLITKHVLYT